MIEMGWDYNEFGEECLVSYFYIKCSDDLRKYYLIPPWDKKKT